MERNSRNKVESLEDNESKSLLQEVGVVSEAPQQNYDIANEDGKEETSLSDQDEPSTILTRQDYILSDEHLLKQHLIEDAIMIGENVGIAERTEKNENITIINEQECFPDQDIKDDMLINGDHFQQAANSEGLHEMALDDDEVSAQDFIDAEHLTEMTSEVARFVSEKSHQLGTEDDPKDKALRYLEESGVIRLFQVSLSFM